MASNDSTWQTVTVKPWLLLALIAACEQKVAGGSADGAQLYQSVCAACHGAKGKPDAAMVARLAVKDLTSAVVRERMTAASVEKQVRDGSTNKLMPAFAGALTDEQIIAVAVYVASSAFVHQAAK
jgi:mono/diheme cytochrome c family protein